MNRVIIVGRGGAGKSTLAARIGEITGIPVVELDTVFWRADLSPTPAGEWAARQRELVAPPQWILDGDLGPYDILEVRLRVADTVIVLDFSLFRCAWRAFRRSRERADFWHWLLGWRRHSRPALLAAIATHAPDARLHILRTPRAAERLISG
jgi:adenylate kinase family enzyme